MCVWCGRVPGMRVTQRAALNLLTAVAVNDDGLFFGRKVIARSPGSGRG